VPSKTKNIGTPTALVKPALRTTSPGSRRFAEVLRQIADPHALLIMRELSLDVRRFQDIQAQTKIGSHLLSSRLQRLQRDGIIERRLCCERPPSFEYFATVKGRELDEVLFAAANWNIKWDDLSLEPSLLVFDKVTGERLGTIPRRPSRAHGTSHHG
jgi:DNA-binding HxlR family transcriptional regulator